MIDDHNELEAFAIELFGGAGEALADGLFAEEIKWPADTPDYCFEHLWDKVVTGLIEHVARVLTTHGVTSQRDITIIQDIAVGAFSDRFTRLNDGWMSKGGTA